MKFNEETMKQALADYSNNEFWMDVYNNAPERAKKRLRVAFWASLHMNEKEDLDAYREYREGVEREMEYEDALYLAQHFPEGAGKTHYNELCTKLEFKALKTDEKLDEAIEVLLEGCSDEERRLIERSRAALKACEDPWFKYELLWSGVGGNGDDCGLLGDLWDHGHGVECDDELAFFWFRRGALSGDGDCCCRLAAMYENKDGPRFDMSRCLFWFREALRRNSKEARVDLGARLTTWGDDDGPWSKLRNPKLGLSLLYSAIRESDEARAHFFVGACYEHGVGHERNLDKALREYRIAERGDVYGAKRCVERVRKLRREERKRHPEE